MHPIANRLVLALVATSIAACATEEIGPDPSAFRIPAGPVIFRLHIVRDPDLPHPVDYASLPTCALQIDGKGFDEAGLFPFPVSFPCALGENAGFSLPSGRHTFTIVDAAGNVTDTAGPYETDDSKVNRLIFFGVRSAQQPLFFADDPDMVPFGKVDVRVVNAARGGKTISVLRCQATDDTVDPHRCVRESPIVSYGESWTAVLPIDAPAVNPGGSGYLAVSADGPTTPRNVLTMSPTNAPGLRDWPFYFTLVDHITAEYLIPYATN